MNSAFEAKNKALDEKIVAISEDNWVLEANRVKKDQLQVIASHLEGERNIVKRFTEMKLDKYMDEASMQAAYEIVSKADEERNEKQMQARLEALDDRAAAERVAALEAAQSSIDPDDFDEVDMRR